MPETTETPRVRVTAAALGNAAEAGWLSPGAVEELSDNLAAWSGETDLVDALFNLADVMAAADATLALEPAENGGMIAVIECWNS